jgi:class 3 adenylate cyclase/pimeloyl-ACP methyl ester carboxylesterase
MDVPDVRYARSGDLAIAYSVSGRGPIDLVLLAMMSNVGYALQHPRIVRMADRLGSFARVILLDRRGTGLSDRPERLPDLEATMDDIRAVMDDVGSQRAVLIGSLEGAQVAALFAASHPERTAALILYNPTARYLKAPDYPEGQSQEELDARLRGIKDGWGTDAFMDGMYASMVPSLGDDEGLRRWFKTYFRLAASPAAALELYRAAIETDIREILPAIRVPTLVVYLASHRAHARYVAARIPDATAVELPGIDHWLAQSEPFVGEIEEFLTGVRRGPDTERVLATVLFTDIVGSTERAADLGDRGWRDLLEMHHTFVRRELEQHRGREVNTTGDGFLATFDGPARAIRCALAIRDAVRDLGVELRAGLHTGECEVVDGKVEGIAVHLGARVASEALPGEVLVSGTVKDLVAGSGFSFDDRGEHELKGVPGTWRLHSVVSA